MLGVGFAFGAIGLDSCSSVGSEQPNARSAQLPGKKCVSPNLLFTGPLVTQPQLDEDCRFCNELEIDHMARTLITHYRPRDVSTMSSGSEAFVVRAAMTYEEIVEERQALTDRGMKRFEDGDRTGLGGARGHQGCGTPFSVFDWFTDEELQRFHVLGLALPSSGELVRDARQRIQERIALRRARRQVLGTLS